MTIYMCPFFVEESWDNEDDIFIDIACRLMDDFPTCGGLMGDCNIPEILEEEGRK